MLEQVAPEQMAKGAVGPQSIRIIANERNNSLLLRGKPQPLAVVNDLIDKLDVPATAMSNTQVIHLSYADATELAETLSQLVGGSAMDESESPIETTIQADVALNAIIARTNPRTMDEIFNIVKQLDTRRAQVLIEAAIAEVSVSELFSVAPKPPPPTNAGGRYPPSTPRSTASSAHYSVAAARTRSAPWMSSRRRNRPPWASSNSIATASPSPSS